MTRLARILLILAFAACAAQCTRVVVLSPPPADGGSPDDPVRDAGFANG